MASATGQGGARAKELETPHSLSPVVGVWKTIGGSGKTLTVTEDGNYEFFDDAEPSASHTGTYLFVGKRLSLRPKQYGDPRSKDLKLKDGEFINFRLSKDKKKLESTDAALPSLKRM